MAGKGEVMVFGVFMGLRILAFEVRAVQRRQATLCAPRGVDRQVTGP